jgi:uncharacterized protein YydD (DUF2326 family)
MEWADVISVDDINKYIEEYIGQDNMYDELYEDLLYGMIRNRESKKRLDKLLGESDSGTILIQPKEL